VQGIAKGESLDGSTKPVLVGVIVRHDAIPHLNGVSADRLPIGQIKTLALPNPLDLREPAVDFELLVRVAGRAGPNLELHAISGRPVGHVEALVAECLDLAGEGFDGDAPGDISVGEGGMEVGVEARDEGDFCAVRVGGRGDAVWAAAVRRRISANQMNDFGGIRIRLPDPLLVGVLTVASVDLKNIAIGNLPVGEINALVRATPLEGGIRHGDPLLVPATFDTGPDLEFCAVCIDTVLYIDALVSKNFDLLGTRIPGRAIFLGRGKESDFPVLILERLGIAVMNNERFTIRIVRDGDTALDSCIEERGVRALDLDSNGRQ